jgi:hypothetical protein
VKPYLVALEADDVTARDRVEAEVRFAKWLERVLGGEDSLADT